MQPLSPEARDAVGRIAARHGFSVDATHAMLDAVVRGGGRMAQFSHPEFSGSGQWMRGGMTMVADMFNNDLKGWVDALCNDLADLIAERPELLRPGAAPRSPMPLRNDEAERPADRAGAVASGRDTDFGAPSSTGSQNGRRYAVHDAARRLVVEQDGATTVYDTLDHRIGGVAQQQGPGGSMRFTSQHGTVDLATLPVVPPADRSAPTADPAPERAAKPAIAGSVDIAATIEKLADLKSRGILSPEEFAAKKVELLARI